MNETPYPAAVDGLYFAEGPRWHDDALWFSDMHGNRVMRHTPDGTTETVVTVTHDEPSGLGWLADGRLLIVAMETQKLLRLEPSGEVSEHADLSGLARGSINDMIVAADGTAYVGDMGLRIHDDGMAARRPGQTIRVTPDGQVSQGADDLEAPNGHILTPDGRTLIVAESSGMRLTAFDVEPDGSLTGRRVFAELVPESPDVPVAPPDGICLDAEGAVWVADPIGRRVFRVLEGGTVTDSFPFNGLVPVACVLGGRDRRTLFMCAAIDWKRDVVRQKPTGGVFTAQVSVPGAGSP
jgi:sugar lactone lactonase YvrE